MAIDNETKERAKAWQAAQTKKAVEQKEDVAIKPAVVIAPKPTNAQRDYTAAKRIALKLIKQSEGCNLTSYPDPASELYKALALHGKLNAYMNGSNRELPENFERLSGEPFTVGYGMTKGVTKDTILTQTEAEMGLLAEVQEVLEQVLKASPALSKATDEAVAAVLSLTFNIGIGNYSQSTVCKKIAAGDMLGAGDAFTMWNKAKGQVLQGLVKRRNTERALFLSKTA